MDKEGFVRKNFKFFEEEMKLFLPNASKTFLKKVLDTKHFKTDSP